MKIPFFSKKPAISAVAMATPSSTESVMNVYARLIDTYVDFSRKDIQKWRNALEMALDIHKPTTVDLQDIYADVSMDAHLQAVIMIRKSSVLNTAFHIYAPDGSIDEDLDSFIARSWASRIVSLLIDGIFFGASVLEIASASLDEGVVFHHIPARNYIPSKGFILLNPTDFTKKILVSDYADSIVPMVSDTPIGIVNNIVAQLIWKRHAQQSWAEFSERFGVPMITATSNQKDKNALSQLEQKLRDAGESMTAVLPTGTTIDIKQPSSTDAFKVFLERINLSNNEISKQIVGGTMIADNGSSKSQSEVHERTLDERIALSDMRMIEFFFNDTLLPVLRESWGINIPPDRYFAFDNANKLSNGEILQLVQTLSATHEIDTEWLSKTFNVPIKLKETTPTDPSQTPPPHEKKKPSAQNAISAVATCCPHIVAVANVPLSIDALVRQLVKNLFQSNGEKDLLLSKALLTAETAQYLASGFRESWQGVSSIGYDSPDYLAYQTMQMNIFRFSCAKSIAQVHAINAALLGEDGRPRTFEQFRQEVSKISSEYNKNWLNTEYNHAIAVAQNTSALYGHINGGAKYVQFRTMGDARVRYLHHLLEGLIMSVNDPNIFRTNPPLDFGCRCEQVEYTGTPPNTVTGDHIFGVLASNGKPVPPDFSIDRSKTQEVFTANQMYLSKVSAEALNGNILKMNQLSFADYGLADTLTSDTPLRLADRTIEETKKAFDSLKDAKNNVSYEDFAKRRMIMKEANFLRHIGSTTSKDQAKYLAENRHLTWDKIPDILQTPHEVYLQEYQGIQQLKYIKAYQEKTLVVVGEMSKGNTFEIKTWYENQREDNNRTGFLIKNEK